MTHWSELQFWGFFTQSELIEPASPQAAQASIFLYFLHITKLNMHLFDGPDKGHSIGEGK